MASATYRLTGMTCEHCVRWVSGEFRALDGVTDVAVEPGPRWHLRGQGHQR